MSEDKKLAGEIERIVLGRIASGKLVIPSSPAAATRCMNLLRQPDFDQRKLVDAIEAEPMLAATVLRGAGGAAYGGSLRGLAQAVQRLGAQRLKTVVIEFASRQLFESRDREIHDASQKVWAHSVAVAILARDLAGLVGQTDADGCYLAGLLHDVGKPVVAAILLEAERKLRPSGPSWLTAEAWSRTVEVAHRSVGVALAEKWGLPDEVTAGIRDCNDYDPGDRPRVANVVRYANAIAKREGFVTGPIDAADVDAMIMVGTSMLGADETVVNRLAKTLAERCEQHLRT
jgi:putative nucleotidyltransferase with HDIG domain